MFRVGAFVSKVVRPRDTRHLLRPLLITCIGVAFAGAAVCSVAATVAVGSSFAFGSRDFLPKPQFHAADRIPVRLADRHDGTGKAPRLRAATSESAGANAAGRGKAARTIPVAERADAAGRAARFDDVVRQAGLKNEEMASLFSRPGAANAQRQMAQARMPAPVRFGPPLAGSFDPAPVLLAYGDPSLAASAALAALLREAQDDGDALPNPSLEPQDELAALPEVEEVPLDIPLPEPRPQYEVSRTAKEGQPAGPGQAGERPAPKSEQPGQAGERPADTPKQLAYARPDDPAEKSSGGGFSLRNLFGGGSSAGNGVAVYDISAAKVFMPDGSVLEAHSGIGEMADNPRYANVRMKGPTPPHVYNLKMREKRFHGVEAIRMLPVDGKNKYGRDGFLTHSYLLRSRKAESHGCVAFKNYDRFLTQFKQGKIKQLVVVPSGGRSAGVRMASNAQSI